MRRVAALALLEQVGFSDEDTQKFYSKNAMALFNLEKALQTTIPTLDPPVRVKLDPDGALKGVTRHALP